MATPNYSFQKRQKELAKKKKKEEKKQQKALASGSNASEKVDPDTLLSTSDAPADDTLQPAADDDSTSS